MLCGCSKKPSHPQERLEPVEKIIEYTHYSKDGLAFDYPKSWTVRFEFGEGIYADKSVGIETPDLSITRIMVFDDSEKDLDYVAAKLEEGFKLEASDKIADVVRSAAKVGKFAGVKASWAHKLIVSIEEQYELFQIEDGDSAVFVSFEFSGEDISTHEQAKLRLLESLKYERQN